MAAPCNEITGLPLGQLLNIVVPLQQQVTNRHLDNVTWIDTHSVTSSDNNNRRPSPTLQVFCVLYAQVPFVYGINGGNINEVRYSAG